jgi:23S rRNA (adenine2030-N6)-methyltransferase
MNYRHVFHAGNFADVFKHVALMLLLRALHKKETPFCYFDTHAGIGRYDLDSPEAERNPEYREGIGRVWGALPEALADYLAAVRAFNADGRLRVYPGSPRIARALLREQDRMVLCEKHPLDCASLRAEFAGDAQTSVHERDAYEALKALLPPRERRGVVLIDPAYEQPDEVDRVIAALADARKRWQTGVYALWYPIKQRAALAPLYDGLRTGGWQKILLAELMVFNEDTTVRLNGCGLAFINPPWGLDASLRECLPTLHRILSRDGMGDSRIEWLVRESD